MLGRRSLALLVCVAGALAGIGAPGGVVAQSSATDERSGPALSIPVQESLLRLQDQWLVWNSALLQDDRELAASVIRDLGGTANEIGFERLPELALAAALRAVEVARDGDPERAGWALGMAEELDPGTPANRFARSRVAWIDGSYIESAFEMARGYSRLWRLPSQRRLWLANAVLWLIYSLVVSAALFVAVQMATKGERILRDLTAALSALPRALALSLAVALLLWPFAIPGGWIWIPWYWLAVVWGYTTSSEKWALSVVLLTLGLAPALVALQLERLDGRSSRELRAVESVEGSRLYGDLFEDLELLQDALPSSTATQQLVADLHVKLGQDELARPLYRSVIEKEPGNGAAINNLGVFHFNRGEYVRAISFFDPAKAKPETAPQAAYNLSSTYRRLLEFGPADSNLGDARNLDSARVAEWIADGTPVVAVEGGIARAGEIRAQLLTRTARRPWERWLRSAAVSLAALALALILPRLGFRGRGGWSSLQAVSENAIEKWARRVIPGIASAHAGDGGRTYLAIALPVAAILLPAASLLGFRLSWGYDPGSSVTWLVSLSALTVFFVLRWKQH